MNLVLDFSLHRLSVSFSAEQKQWLEEQVRTYGCTESKVVRVALDSAMALPDFYLLNDSITCKSRSSISISKHQSNWANGCAESMHASRAAVIRRAIDIAMADWSGLDAIAAVARGRAIAKHAKQVLKCEECGSDYNGCRSRFCSSRCRSKNWIRRHPRQVIEKVPKKRPECPGCGKSFRNLRDEKCGNCKHKALLALRKESRCHRCRRQVEKCLCAMCACGQPKNLESTRCQSCKENARGTKWHDRNGYAYIRIGKDYPGANSTGSIFEHRFVMERHIGRILLPSETVHHKNGIRNDNRIENLELWSGNHPRGSRVSDKIAWAVEFLSQYGSVSFRKAL